MTDQVASSLPSALSSKARFPRRRHTTSAVSRSTPRRVADAFDKDPEDHRAIVIGQVDQAGLGDKPTELDQLARSFTPLHYASPHAAPRPSKQQPVSSGDQSSTCRQRREQLRLRRAPNGERK